MTTIAPMWKSMMRQNTLVSARGTSRRGVLGLARCHTDHLGALEGEACDHEDGRARRGAPPTKGASPTVQLETPGELPPRMPKIDGDTGDEEDDHGDDLDGGQPELRSP